MTEETEPFPSLPRRDVLLWVLMVVLPLVALPILPDPVPIHWNLHGEPDRWVARWPGVLLFLLIPAFTLLFWLFAWAVGRGAGEDSDDPRAVRRALGQVRTGVVLLMLLVEGAALGEAAGWPVSAGRMSLALMGLGFAGMGPLMREIPRNAWIGVRTPWTLDDDRVWERTHRFAARVFPAGGLLVTAAALLPAPLQLVTGLALLVAAALLPVAYSYRIRTGD